MPLYHHIPAWFRSIFPRYEWHINEANDQNYYLTFDDGPHPEITPWVLDQLDAFGAKATFFCVGDNVRKYPKVYQEILNRGHRCGNHTMHHIKGWSVSTEKYLEDVMACSKWVESDLFRPPYGRISRSQSKQVAGKFRIIMWSLLSCDFITNLNLSSALARIKKKTKSGSIIVFHDSEKAEKNLRVLLPAYLDAMKEKGLISIAL